MELRNERRVHELWDKEQGTVMQGVSLFFFVTDLCYWSTFRFLGYGMGTEKHAGLQKRRVEQLSLIDGVGTEGCSVINLITKPESVFQDR